MRWRILTGLVAMGLLAAACTAGGDEEGAAPPADTSSDQEPVTLTMWVPFSGREYRDLAPVFEGFTEAYPWITLDLRPGLGENDEKMLAAIRAGNPPDAVMSWSLDSIAKFCQTGAWVDLQPYMEQSGLDPSSVFPESVTRYTSFEGSNCALPFLTDAMGLYYNTDMFEKAGLSEPPRTMSELTDMAKELTQFNPDGSIKVAGFVPWFGYYEFTPLELSIIWGADWYSDDGRSAVGSDSDWPALFEWQKELVDFYGVDNLRRFVAGQGDEWSSANDFQNGRVAMMFDGEWRTAFIANDAPNLNYATAPYPVPDGRDDQYGLGRVGGTIVGIPRGSPHPAEAWLLVEYLATDTDALVYASNTIRNVPTTFEALESPELDVTPQFQTFLDVFAHPESHYKDHSIIGSTDQDLVSGFGEDWQVGDVSNLQAGLDQVAQQIDDQVAQAG
jgi:multiple sugar transport system substrate-binding protein